MGSGARIGLGLFLGGLLHCLICVSFVILTSLAVDGTRHLGETMAYGIGFTILTAPGGVGLGALSAALVRRLGPPGVAALGAGIGLVVGLVVTVLLVSMSRGNIVVAGIGTVLSTAGAAILAGVVGVVTAKGT